MTQILKKDIFNVDNIKEYYQKFYKNSKKQKSVILNYLFRNITFLTSSDKIRTITKDEYIQISNELNIPKSLIHKFISQFLVSLLNLRKFIQMNPDVLHIKDHTQPLKIFLRLFYRLAPIFDYKRARINILILKKKLNVLCFWPQLMTQAAIVIFITDYLDKTQIKKLKQANIRALCHCSAYAFHRSRNKIGLTPKVLKNLLN
jgi:hypothetical protein